MEVTNLQNANNDILTPLIRKEFEKIYFEFSNTAQKPIYLHSVLNLILTYKSSNILLNDENKTFVNENFIKYQEIFNTGFKEGYIIAKEYTEDTIYIKIKIDRVFGGIYKKLNSLKETHTFLIKADDSNYSFESLRYYNYGIEVGKYVMCWDYILNNYNLFEDIFKSKYAKHKTTTHSAITTNTGNIFDKQGTFLEFSKSTEFENNIDKVEETLVLKYFTEELVNKKYLDTNTLNKYLKQAFDERKKPENRFSFSGINTQQKIINIFYRYYKDIAGKPYGKQSEYINLLGDYFNGFETKKIKTNFSK